MYFWVMESILQNFLILVVKLESLLHMKKVCLLSNGQAKYRKIDMFVFTI